MQIFSDGGYCDGAGASGFVVVSIGRRPPFERVLEGYRGVFLHEAVSAFQTEMVAAELAVQFVAGLLSLHKRR